MLTLQVKCCKPKLPGFTMIYFYVVKILLAITGPARIASHPQEPSLQVAARGILPCD